VLLQVQQSAGEFREQLDRRRHSERRHIRTVRDRTADDADRSQREVSHELSVPAGSLSSDPFPHPATSISTPGTTMHRAQIAGHGAVRNCDMLCVVKLSYSKGPDIELLEATIGEALRETASRYPDREALVVRHQQRRYTWRELDRAVDSWTGGLAALGLTREDRVGIWSANCAEWVLLQLACARAGMVLVNVNPAYRSHELGFVLGKSRMKALFLWPRDPRADYAKILEDSRPPADLRVVELGGEFGGPAWAAEAVASSAVVNIQYTSGTTGFPKGVLLTHRNLLNNGWLVARQMKLTQADRLCVPVPLYHCFGCVMGVLASVATGCTLVLPNWTFGARATLEAIRDERATAVYGVPTMFIAMLEHPDFAQFDLSSLRTGIMAGAPCPVEVMKQVVSRMHCGEVTIAYGQTESSPVITQSGAGDPIEVRVSTVGRVLPNTEVKIVSPATGETAAEGGQGELCTRGYLVMAGYDGEPEATARAIDSDGWLHTGDLAVMREDGNFRITGRAKDMIIRGGENIYPREIEEFLYTHPKIADVQVVGLPHARLGESVCAWVRLKAGESLTEDELKRWCTGRIAHFKVPDVVRFVEAFPMTVTGKIQKYRIREIEIERLGLLSAAEISTA
jgi:fatty-acyl-CoA synthase